MPFIQTQNTNLIANVASLFAGNATLLISEICYIHFSEICYIANF